MLINAGQYAWIHFVVTAHKCFSYAACLSDRNLRHSSRVHLASHLQPVETLHVADGFGQNLSRLHGGHLSAGLGQIAELTEPSL